MGAKIILEVPNDVPESALKKAREAAVLALWEEGGLSTSDAAAELGLSYHDFLELTGEKGLTAEDGPLNVEAIERAERILHGYRVRPAIYDDTLRLAGELP